MPPDGADAGLVRLWWIGLGPADRRGLEDVRAHVERVFAGEARLEDVAERPLDAYDARRRQHSSTRILAWLAGRAPDGGSRVLGLTDVDLFIPILTFVYGEAQLRGRTAVVSAARLVEARAPGSPLSIARLAKEAVHELGHCFGLLHCEEARCVMSRSVNLHEVDRKASTLCHDCAILFREARAGLEVPR
jgi:archaemetzincin